VARAGPIGAAPDDRLRIIHFSLIPCQCQFALQRSTLLCSIETKKDCLLLLAWQPTQWEDAAALCRWVANEPMFPEHKVAATEMTNFFQNNAISLRERGYLANLDRQVESYVLGRSSGLRGDDEVRGRTRAIAADAHRIFGSWLYGTVATVATVALGKKVSPKSVENWCDGLPTSGTAS
jgi:hypothetical protein